MNLEAEDLENITAIQAAPPSRGLQDAIPERLGDQNEHYQVEYGIRSDDNAMVFHFYPPDTDWSTNPPTFGKWSEAYGMHNRLEGALAKVFDVNKLKATYTEELRSFCIIAYGIGFNPDPFYFARSLFEKIETP